MVSSCYLSIRDSHDRELRQIVVHDGTLPGDLAIGLDLTDAYDVNELRLEILDAMRIHTDDAAPKAAPTAAAGE